MSGTGFAYPGLFGKKVPPPAPRWAGNAEIQFHRRPQRPQPDSDRRADRGNALPCCAARGRSWRCTAWRRGRRAIAACASSSPTSSQRWRGIKAGADDVLITSGSGQAIDLINQVLLEPGDTVILEEFTYGGYLTKLRRIGVNIVGAPLDEDGIRVDALAQILADLKVKGTTPKYICTVPTIQNPTGSIMPLERRRQLLAVAAEYGVPIFEDECYADLTWGGMDAPPALYSLDPEPGHSYRLVLEDLGAGVAARLCRRRLGIPEPHDRDQERRRQRHRRARTDGRRRIFLEAFRGAMSTS